MATQPIENLKQPLMSQIVREQPETNMEGNVTNTSIVKNLLDAMRDINFNDLVNTFADMSAVKSPVKTDTEATKGLMAEVKTPPTPKEVEESQEAQPQQEFIAPEAPTPTSDAMKMNQVYRPPAAIEQNTDTGLMTAV
jgi:hypothetical protein|tara:strand:+ start:458 stop:871 length:414 start_codon:yes stop_codon:yes gene_type:complete